jgi:hypothetical protein
MLMGFFLSWLIPETNGKTLEELWGEDSENEIHKLGKEKSSLERQTERGIRTAPSSVRCCQNATGSGV